MLSIYTALRIWNWAIKRKTEIRNWEPEEPCKTTTTTTKPPKERFHFLLLLIEKVSSEYRGVCPVHMAAGHTPVAPPQEGIVGSYDVLACIWNRLAQHHLSLSSPFTVWFISACPWWISNAFMLSMFFPALANPGPMLRCKENNYQWLCIVWDLRIL